MSEPLTLIESRRTVRTAPPANLPRALASVTVPLTLAPVVLLLRSTIDVNINTGLPTMNGVPGTVRNV